MENRIASELDSSLLIQGVKNRDLKLLEWHEPLLSPYLQQLPHSNVRIASNGDQKLKPYDRLIHKKSLSIFKNIDTNKRTWETLEEEENSMPLGAPLECYMGCTDEQQLRWQFLKDLSEGDIIIGEIINWRRSQYELKFICMDGGQARFIKNITIFCQVVQKNEILEEGDYLRCVLIGIQNENLLASTDQDELKRIDPLLSLKITLGSIERRDFPVHYDHIEKLNSDSSLVGDLCQNENNPFINPNGTSYLLERLGVDITDRLSFLDESIFPIPKQEHCKDHLRKAQSKESAQVYVSRGVEQFKKGECQQALNFYNQALDLDNENVDALVARGALYNSRKQYPKACKDLEEAYRLDKNHKNAKRYLIQILFEHAGILSKAAKNKDDLEQSVTCLKRILELDSDHHEARSKLRILTKPSVFNDITPQIPKISDLPEYIPRRPSTEDKVSTIDLQIKELLEKKRRKADKKAKKEKKEAKKAKKRRSRSRSRSRSNSPRRREDRRRNSSSSSVITIEDSDQNSRSRRSSSSSQSRKESNIRRSAVPPPSVGGVGGGRGKPEKAIYMPPRRESDRPTIEKMDAINKKN